MTAQPARDRTDRTFRTVSRSTATHPAPIGTAVALAYDVNDPSRAVSVGGARTLAIVGTGLAALFALLAASCVVTFVALSL